MTQIIKGNGGFYIVKDGVIKLGSTKLATLLIRWSQIKREGAH